MTPDKQNSLITKWVKLLHMRATLHQLSAKFVYLGNNEYAILTAYPNDRVTVKDGGVYLTVISGKSLRVFQVDVESHLAISG